MARLLAKAKTSSVNHRSTSALAALSASCRDLDQWPRSWMGLDTDLPPGERLLASLRPFLEQLAASNLSPTTIRRHVDNVWRLGGEVIRDLHDDPSLRKVAADRLLRTVVHQDGGPLLYNGSEDEQRSFDSTCRKLHRFLTQPQR